MFQRLHSLNVFYVLGGYLKKPSVCVPLTSLCRCVVLVSLNRYAKVVFFVILQSSQ